MQGSMSQERIEQEIRSRLQNGGLIFGFGHPVLRVEDPRATIIFRYLEQNFSDHSYVKLALAVRVAGTRVLKENPKISSPYPNVDSVSGILLAAGGFFHPQYFPVLFGLPRQCGIAIQIVDDRESRGGKGTPIVRPETVYRSKVVA